MKTTEFQKLLRTAIDNCDENARLSIESILVEPYQQNRCWDHGDWDEPDYPCWIFLEFRNSEEGLCYSEFGFGSIGAPWGFVRLKEDFFGQDSLWFSNLNDLWKQFGERRVSVLEPETS